MLERIFDWLANLLRIDVKEIKYLTGKGNKCSKPL